jgi:hypothetical protein
MAKDRMTTSSPEYKTMMLKKVYDYALKNTDSDRLTIKVLKLHNKPSRKKKAVMATRGMGAALKKGGMSKMKKKGGMSKGKKYI